MNPEKYWAQTRAKWEARVADPYGAPLECGFCNFVSRHGRDFCGGNSCRACPVVAVYGHNCGTIGMLDAYAQAHYRADDEELRALAAAVVQELDDKREELIAAMSKLSWR